MPTTTRSREGDGGRHRPEDGGRDCGAGDSSRDPEGQGHREGQVSQEYESEAAGREGDVSKDGSYDALRFCDPKVTLAANGEAATVSVAGSPRLCRRSLKGSSSNPLFAGMRSSLSFDHDNASVSDGADFFDIDDEASEHHDASGLPDDQVLFECRDLTLDDEANFFYDSGDFSFATLLDLFEKFQAKLGKYGTKRASVINPDTEVYCPFGLLFWEE